MCTSPVFLKRGSLYGFSFDVPCGSCLECRRTLQDAWVFRLTHDLDALYKAGGNAVFLTFTYNNKCLPHTNFGFDDGDVECFNNHDVLCFLNKVKVYMHRKFGKSSYKYFVCEEYGKNTKRPHLHGIFMLSKGVKPFAFVEKMRSYWHFGYMFPRCKNGLYVDSKGRATVPLLRSVNKAGAYAAKYITKDLDYYKLPLVSKYSDVRKTLPSDLRKHYDNYLPKHFQSKSLGSSFDSFCNTPDKLLKCVINGVQSLVNLKMVQIPRYYVLKFAFSTENTPVGYRSVLKDDYQPIMQAIYERSLQSKVNQLDSFRLSKPLFVHRDDLSIDDLKLIDRVHSMYSSEHIVCMNFVSNLDFKFQYLFHRFYNSFSIKNVAEFRCRFLNHVVVDDNFYSPYDINYFDDVKRYYKIATSYILSARAEANLKRYRDFLINRKLKYLSYA